VIQQPSQLADSQTLKKKKRYKNRLFGTISPKMAQEHALTVPKERVRKGKSNFVQKIKLNQNIGGKGTVFLEKEPV
jgi:hypothetical protein